MSLYTVMKFVHIAAAIVLVGSYLLAPVLHGAIRGATEVRALRALARLQHRVLSVAPPAALLVLGAGVYLTLSGWSFTDGWIIVSITLFVANGALATAIVDPHVKKLLAATNDPGDGPIDPTLRGLVNDVRVLVAQRFVIGIDVAIVFLMVNKPGWAGSVAVAGTGLALGAALATVASKRMRQPVHARVTAE